MADPLVSILIVNWNTRDLTFACLDSLAGAADGVSYEVIVVDNGSVDGSADSLAQRTAIELIRNDSNRGFAAAVNQAYRRSNGELVLLLNSDVELTPGSLGALTRFLGERPSIAGAAPVYVNPDGSPQPFHFRFPTFAMTLSNGSTTFRRLFPGSGRLLREYKMLGEDFSRPRPVPQPSASCLLLRRSCLSDDSIMDEGYPLYFNDVQFARSLANQGLELWVTPDAVAIHNAHASGLKLDPRARRRQYVGGAVRMLMETEAPFKVWIYRVVIFGQNIVNSVLGRPEALRGANLWRALAGDPGPLPTRPSH